MIAGKFFHGSYRFDYFWSKVFLIVRKVLRNKPLPTGTVMGLTLLAMSALKYGPEFEHKIFRYSIAGTFATVFTEGAIHFVDTINMQSKVQGGPDPVTATQGLGFGARLSNLF